MGVYLADPKAIAGETAPVIPPPAEEQIEQEPVLLNKSRTRHTHTIKERERERERERPGFSFGCSQDIERCNGTSNTDVGPVKVTPKK